MPASNIKYLDSLKTVLQTGAVKQLLFMFGLAISVALGIVLFMSTQEPLYRPLDYQVTEQNMNSIIDTLDKAGIRYKINDRDGIVLVPMKDLQRARMKLAAAGVPRDDNFTYAFLNDQNGLISSQFLDNARYLRALENDLSKTISAIEGVAAARVHLAIPQNNVFADESTKPTASVMLNIAPGFMSDKEKIRSIMQIIAGSVPGLDPKNVSITDQFGHYLSEGLDQNSVYNAAQLSYQNNIQNYYEKRIESMITPMLGENKVSVRVSADIDFTQQEDAQEQYDPDKKVIRSEQTSSDQLDSGGASGVPGSLSNAPPEDGKAAAAGSGSSSSGRQSTRSVKNYELSRSVTYKKTNSAKIKSLSVAVILDNEMIMDPKTKQYVSKPLSQEKITKITDLVKATIGYDQGRGDKVTVVNSGFNLPKAELAPPAAHFWEQPWFWDAAKRLAGIVISFIFLCLLYRRLATYLTDTRQIRTTRALSDDSEEGGENVTMKMHELKQEGMSRLKQLATSEPNKVALIIKNWVGKQ